MVNWELIGKGVSYGAVVWIFIATGYFLFITLKKFIEEIIKRKRTDSIMPKIDVKYSSKSARKDPAIRYLRERAIIKARLSKYEVSCYQGRKQKQKQKLAKEEKKNGITKSIKEENKYWNWFKRTFSRRKKTTATEKGTGTGRSDTKPNGNAEPERVLQVSSSRGVRKNKRRPEYIKQQHSLFN